MNVCKLKNIKHTFLHNFPHTWTFVSNLCRLPFFLSHADLFSRKRFGFLMFEISNIASLLIQLIQLIKSVTLLQCILLLLILRPSTYYNYIYRSLGQPWPANLLDAALSVKLLWAHEKLCTHSYWEFNPLCVCSCCQKTLFQHISRISIH